MSNNTLLSKLMPVIRNLTDLGLKISGKLIAYDNVTLYRYSVKESEYRDTDKTLIETVTNIHMYVDFPGEVPFLNTSSNLAVDNVTFIEDLLPIVAIFPWKHNDEDLKVDVLDEFEIILTDEFGNDKTLRFVINERKSDWSEQLVYRDFIISSVRSDTQDFTDKDKEQTGVQPVDPNLEIGKEKTDIYSQYD